MVPFVTSRRNFLATTALAGAALPIARAAAAQDVQVPPSSGGGDYQYEIERTAAEWQELLSEDEYNILREGGTEWPTSHPLWNDYTEGVFHCRGCDLPLFDSEWRARVQLGWVFFHHALPNSILTGIDTAEGYPGGDPNKTLVEAHCRRCASHLGHILKIEEEMLHCINGTSLVRRDSTA